MWAFPGSKLNEYCEQIVILAWANKTLALFHERRKQDVASGGRPKLRQSLETTFTTVLIPGAGSKAESEPAELPPRSAGSRVSYPSAAFLPTTLQEIL